jgi:D-beta-D-heptose 7-phosphate kinase/D-beta-D-heptose 1-phosphate adenosyltransferase
MSRDLFALIDAFAGRRVLVVGDAVLDSYLDGHPERFCREAPVPTVAVGTRTDVPGGAANTAVNVRSLGGECVFVTALGDDVEGQYLRRALADRGVSADAAVVVPGRRTVAKHRIVADAQILLRYDQGDAGRLPPADERRLIDRLSALYSTCDAVILSDYGAGVFSPRVLAAVRRLNRRHPRVVVADSRRRLADFRGLGVTAVKPNFDEAVGLLGLRDGDFATDRARRMGAYRDRLHELTGARIVAQTLDADGAVFFEPGQPAYHIAACGARPGCVAGAGDTFVAAMALALAAGATTRAMGELACAAAAVVVRKDGTATCSASELREHLAPPGKLVRDLDRLVSRVEFLRRQGRRIGFTNGCFDLLHRGHVSHLHHARGLADVLIVGVNSDAGVRRLKGPGRPINPLDDRLHVLAALDCVDHLVPFDEDTAGNLIRALRPDVFVKGGNYTRANLPEVAVVEALGGVVEILPYLPDRSTTGLLERIRGQHHAAVAEAVAIP